MYVENFEQNMLNKPLLNKSLVGAEDFGKSEPSAVMFKEEP